MGERPRGAEHHVLFLHCIALWLCSAHLPHTLSLAFYTRTPFVGVSPHTERIIPLLFIALFAPLLFHDFSFGIARSYHT